MWRAGTRSRPIAYARRVRWERFFEDLEGQLDSEWEAERAALETESARLRLSRIPLRSRLVALSEQGAAVSLDLSDGTTLAGRLRAVGADWLAIAGDGSLRALWLVPIAKISAAGMPHVDLLDSARQADAGGALRQRMTFGFVARDFARKRVPVTIQVAGGRLLSGTIDRAGADHLDLALHDAGAPRRAGDVLGHRVVAFGAIVWLRPDAAVSVP